MRPSNFSERAVVNKSKRENIDLIRLKTQLNISRKKSKKYQNSISKNFSINSFYFWIFLIAFLILYYITLITIN